MFSLKQKTECQQVGTSVEHTYCRNKAKKRRITLGNSRRTVFQNEQRHLRLRSLPHPTVGLLLPLPLRRSAGKLLAEHEHHRQVLRLLEERGAGCGAEARCAGVHPRAGELR